MREIKFRVWDIVMQEMGVEFPIIDLISDWFYKRDPIQYNIMQYTGLKDKNGKEIYEGDIADIRYSGGGHTRDMYTPCVCKFGEFDHANPDRTILVEIYPCFYFEQVALPYNIFPLQTSRNKGIEVIGNIYENPELLKPAPVTLHDQGDVITIEKLRGRD